MDSQRAPGAWSGAMEPVSAMDVSTRRILILGGTTEARLLAERLAARDDINVTVSLAGRTRKPLDMPATVRIGGFGGAEGLADYLRAEAIDALVDATHPFAATMSFNAAAAARLAGVPLLALARAPWERQPGDLWREAADVAQAVAPARCGAAPRAGRARPQRSACAGGGAAACLSGCAASIRSSRRCGWTMRTTSWRADRFLNGRSATLLKRHRIDAVLAKNSGGDATYGKIAAARTLGIEVILVKRPPARTCRRSAASTRRWNGSNGL